MPACKLSLTTPDAAQARALAGALENLLEPPPDAVTQFEEGPAAWRIEAYFSEAPDLDAIRPLLEDAAGVAMPNLQLDEIPDLNWVAISQAALPPVSAGRFTVHGSHDRGRIPQGPNTILVDAGEAFGTAHHATTQGCLKAIDRLTRIATFANVLDLGCGSGVLAIAAARALRGARILATDNDPEAIAVAARNAAENGVRARIAFACASGLTHPWLRHAAPFDLIIANILAGPLCMLAPDVAKAICPGGVIVLSGILNPEAAQVRATYVAHGFALIDHQRIAGWSTLTLQRR